MHPATVRERHDSWFLRRRSRLLTRALRGIHDGHQPRVCNSTMADKPLSFNGG